MPPCHIKERLRALRSVQVDSDPNSVSIPLNPTLFQVMLRELLELLRIRHALGADRVERAGAVLCIKVTFFGTRNQIPPLKTFGGFHAFLE
jgi:hypothetical protein